MAWRTVQAFQGQHKTCKFLTVKPPDRPQQARIFEASPTIIAALNEAAQPNPVRTGGQVCRYRKHDEFECVWALARTCAYTRKLCMSVKWALPESQLHYVVILLFATLGLVKSHTHGSNLDSWLLEVFQNHGHPDA